MDNIHIYIEKIFGNARTCKNNDEINKYKHKLHQLSGLIFGFLIINHKKTQNELTRVILYMSKNKWKIDASITDNIFIRTLLCGMLGSKCIDETLRLSQNQSNICKATCLMTTLIINNILISSYSYKEWIKVQDNILNCCEKIHNDDIWKFNRCIFTNFNPEKKMSLDIEEFKKIKIKNINKPYELNMMMLIWVVKRIIFFMNRLEQIFEKKHNCSKIKGALKIKFFQLIFKILADYNIYTNLEFKKNNDCIILAISGCLLGYSSLPNKLLLEIYDINWFRNVFLNFITS